jgi:amidase/6-aminohexanoate-cyclic-dimer hydrolase
MMQAWTRIVACGTALSVRNTLQRLGRGLQEGDLQRISQAAIRYADNISGADYLHAVETIHAYGRQMAAAFTDYDIILSSTLSEPAAKIERFTHDRDDYEAYRIGEGGVFAYSPFCATFNASGQPAASVPLHWTADGLPVGVHFAAAFGQDATLIALCAECEQAQPWWGRQAPMTR